MPFRLPGPQEPPEANWCYTVAVRKTGVDEERRLREALNGRKERHTITRGSSVDGGVYEVPYVAEATVVDFDNSAHIQLAYGRIWEAISDEKGRPDKHKALSTVFHYVANNLKYDQGAVNNIFERSQKDVHQPKISLEVYVANRVGVCRHQALFVAVLLERLKKDGVITGEVSMERNMLQLSNGESVGHSWVRYTNSSGQVFILDVAQSISEELDTLMDKRRRGELVWDYARPEDHERCKRQRNKGRLGFFALNRREYPSPRPSDKQKPTLEYDENGLIIIPDSVRRNIGR